MKTIRVDACGLQCPGPILKMKKTMDSLVSGDRVEITSTDPGFPRDAAAWCNSTGNQLISKETAGGKSAAVASVLFIAVQRDNRFLFTVYGKDGILE